MLGNPSLFSKSQPTDDLMEFESKDLGKPPQDQRSSPLFTESSVSVSSPGYCFLLLLLTVTNTVGSTQLFSAWGY